MPRFQNNLRDNDSYIVCEFNKAVEASTGKVYEEKKKSPL